MRLGARDPLPPLLALALVAGLAVELLLPPSPPPVTPAVRMSRPVAPAGLVEAAPASYPAILGRPLFSPTRSAAASTGPAAPAGTFALLGVATDGGRASASLRDTAGLITTLREGESLQGWRLVAVGRDRAVLRLGSVSQSLQVGVVPPLGSAAPAANGVQSPGA